MREYVITIQTAERSRRTLSRPRHLLILIDTGHRSAKLEPHSATPIPSLRALTCGDFGKIVLRWPGMIDLLSRDIVDRSAGWHVHDIGRIGRLVAADVRSGGVFNALF
jgi:hypothetical protein